jgi:hypothetical protein
MKLNDIKLLREFDDLLDGYEPSQIVEIIERQCKPWLDEVSNGSLRRYLGSPFYRGVKSRSHFFYKPVRPDRQPKDTHPYVHDMFVDFLEKEDAVANRDNSAFISADPEDAARYGELFVIFPVGNFHYTWIKGINDLTGDFNVILQRVSDRHVRGMSEIDATDPKHRRFVDQAFKILKENIIKGGLFIDEFIRSAEDEEVLLHASGMYYVRNEDVSLLLEEVS